jgi:hypothetical protein
MAPFGSTGGAADHFTSLELITVWGSPPKARLVNATRNTIPVTLGITCKVNLLINNLPLFLSEHIGLQNVPMATQI